MISYILFLSIPAVVIVITTISIKRSKTLSLNHKLLIAICILLAVCIYLPASYRITGLYYKLNTVTVIDKNDIPVSNALVMVEYMSTEFNIADGVVKPFKVEIIETDSNGVANITKTMKEIPVMFFPVYCRMDSDPLVIIVKDNYRLVKKIVAKNDVNITIRLSEKYNDIKVPNSYQHYVNDYGSAFLESNLKEYINAKSYTILKKHLLSNLSTVAHDDGIHYSAYMERYNDGIKSLGQVR